MKRLTVFPMSEAINRYRFRANEEDPRLLAYWLGRLYYEDCQAPREARDG